jgi:hypothetical protein
MSSNQKNMIHHIQNIHRDLLNTWLNYWHDYSYFNTWQFWFILALLILPLIAIYFFIDKRKALLIGFFGFNVHVWFTYIDTIGGATNLWFYPYKIIPLFTTSFALDVSFVPVAYMLVFQWIINHNKNYYLYIFLLCVFMSFVFKPLLSYLGLFQLTKANYFHLFLGYIAIALVSKIITNVFIGFEKKATNAK